MLPALNHRPNIDSHQIDRIKDQLDFAERDIEEERRERIRMREQLSIQNDIISKLYSRINQIEEEQAESSKIMTRVMEDSLLQQQLDTRKQAKLDRNTVSDLDNVKKRFTSFTESVRRETEEVKHLSNDTHSSLINIQEYLKTLHQSDQCKGTRITTLESNTNAAIDCIKSLQSASARLQTKVAGVESCTQSRGEEVAASLQEVTRCINEANIERSQLHQLVNNSTLDLSELKQNMEEKLHKTRQEMFATRDKKDMAITQTLEEIAEYYRTIDDKISDEVSINVKDTKIMFNSLQISLAKEKSLRLEWEQKLRRDTANVLNNLRQNLREQMTQYIQVYEENKTKVDKSIKQLNKSIGLIEQSNEATKHGLEHILQAEIKSRLSRFHDLEDHLKTVRGALAALDNRREEDLSRVKEEVLEEIKKFQASTAEEMQLLTREVAGIKEGAQQQVEKAAQETKAMVSGVEEKLYSHLEQQISEAQEQMEVVTSTLIEDKLAPTETLLANLHSDCSALVEANSALQDDIKRERESRQKDLMTISQEMSVKQDKLSHEAALAALYATIASANNSLYEAEEKVTSLEVSLEESAQQLQTNIEAIALQVESVNDTINPLKEQGSMTWIAQEIQDIKSEIKKIVEFQAAARLPSTPATGPPSPVNKPSTPAASPTGLANKPPTAGPPSPALQPDHGPPPNKPPTAGPPSPAHDLPPNSLNTSQTTPEPALAASADQFVNLNTESLIPEQL